VEEESTVEEAVITGATEAEEEVVTTGDTTTMGATEATAGIMEAMVIMTA
jgi:hypothetical protein